MEIKQILNRIVKSVDLNIQETPSFAEQTGSCSELFIQLSQSIEKNPTKPAYFSQEITVSFPNTKPEKIVVFAGYSCYAREQNSTFSGKIYHGIVIPKNESEIKKIIQSSNTRHKYVTEYPTIAIRASFLEVNKVAPHILVVRSNINTHPNYRGLGIGSTLLKNTEENMGKLLQAVSNNFHNIEKASIYITDESTPNKWTSRRMQSTLNSLGFRNHYNIEGKIEFVREIVF